MYEIEVSWSLFVPWIEMIEESRDESLDCKSLILLEIMTSKSDNFLSLALCFKSVVCKSFRLSS